MRDVDVRYGTAPEGAELSLSGGPWQWVDDAIAGAAVVVIVTVLVSRAYRWVKAQGENPREAVEARVHQVQEAGSAAVRAWRHGDHPPQLLIADGGVQPEQPVSAASAAER